MGPSDVEPQKIELVLAQLESLPPLAPVATRILALTDSSKSNARQIVDLIGSDPSLTVRILSLLSRAEHAVRPEAVSLENAVGMLGFNAIRQATLASKVMEVFGSGSTKDKQETDFDRGEFWKHCLGVACAARRIALHVSSRVDPEEAFVLGLLHDIGKIALSTVMPKSFARIVRKANASRADIADIERAVLGIDHTVVGRHLGERWNLPQPLVDCVWLHHQPPEGLPASIAAGKHVQIVQLADALVREQRIGYSGNHNFAVSSRELAERIGLPEADRIATIESLAEEIEARAAWIGVEEITSREVYLRALMQTTEELTAANVALTEQNRLLERRAEYFTALGWLNQAVSPKASCREVCGAAAETLRRALSVPAMLVFGTARDGRWVETGFSDGKIRTDVLERPPGSPDETADAEAAAQLAKAGTWIAPPARVFDALTDRYRGQLGTGSVWLLPLIRERKWCGGAIFTAPTDVVAALRGEAAQIEALSAAVGLAIAQAQTRGEALAMSDELAQINRRWAATQAELVRARALQTVVAMAAGAAHELNNPLAVISGRAQMLRGRVQDEETKRLLDMIAKQAQACSDIVTELMDFANPRPPSPGPIDLRDFLNSLVKELADAGLLDGSCLSVELPSDTLMVRFDREQLRGVFRELLLNSVDATDAASRRLTIKAAADLAEESVVIEVTDNGRGMTAEVLANAMDPFFSHRPAGRGRGLGLARAQRWLQQNGGAMRIRSRPTEGTTAELRVPAMARPPA
jgi:putative nucleotidyltransferase with HDIG domain